MLIKYKGKTFGGGSGSIQTGDTLVDNDGVVDVKTPVKGIMTQDEFDALPEDQRNHGVYFIPGNESGEMSSAENLYSTDETRIGTWIDGKPLYRRVIENIGPSVIDSPKTLYTFNEAVNILDIRGTCSISSHIMPINFSSNSTGEYIWTYYIIGNRSLTMRIGHSVYLNCKCIVMVEYTKSAEAGLLRENQFSQISSSQSVSGQESI